MRRWQRESVDLSRARPALGLVGLQPRPVPAPSFFRAEQTGEFQARVSRCASPPGRARARRQPIGWGLNVIRRPATLARGFGLRRADACPGIVVANSAFGSRQQNARASAGNEAERIGSALDELFAYLAAPPAAANLPARIRVEALPIPAPQPGRDPGRRQASSFSSIRTKAIRRDIATPPDGMWQTRLRTMARGARPGPRRCRPDGGRLRVPS